MWQRNCLAVTIAALAASAAPAQHAAAPMLEMQARGELAIGPDGNVSEYRLDTKLADDVAALVDRNVRAWAFEPIVVDGKAVTAKTSFHLTLNAVPADDQPQKGNYLLRVENVSFGEPMKSSQLKPPRYPGSAIKSRVGAKVILSVRLDEHGNVVEALPYQTSLDRRAHTEQQAEQWRKVFEQTSLEAVKTWHYELSERVDGKAMGTWARVPVVYTVMEMGRKPRDDQWRAFVPGPIHPRPGDAANGLADSRDLSAMKEDDVLADSRFRLKQDVTGKTL